MLSTYSTLVMFITTFLHGIVNASNSTVNCTDIDWSDVNTTNTALLSHIFQQCLNRNLPYEDCPDPTICEQGEPNSKNIALAFGLTIGAGLATTIGALIPFVPCIRRSDTKYLAAALALAAGVMIHVSYTEIYDESRNYFCCVTVAHYDLVTAASFFVGIILTVLLDLVVRSLEKIDCGCSYANCKESCQLRRETRIPQHNDTVTQDIPMDTVTNQVQATNVSSLQNGGLFHTQRSDQGSLLDTAFDQRSVPSSNNSPTIPNNNNNINTDLSLPDADSHLERGSLSAGSTAISMTTNNLGDASIQDLLSNTSIHRMHTVAELASNNMEAISHVSISLMNENEDGLSLNPSLRTQPYPNGDLNSRISAPSLQRRTSYEEMVEQQEDTRTEGMEQFRLVTDIVNPDVNKLRRMGVLTGLAIAIHNFPEGLATFVATLSDPSLGGALALAIALHNIPEGICVAMPVYYATGSRLKAFFWAFLSGISEPFGALLGWLILQRLFGPLVYGISFGIIAGMMIYISLKEILPMAHKFDSTKGILVTIFLVIGMFIMAVSLVLFAY